MVLDLFILSEFIYASLEDLDGILWQLCIFLKKKKIERNPFNVFLIQVTVSSHFNLDFTILL